MISVAAIIDGVLQREGWPQLTNRPSDKGGWTKGGITAAAWGDYAHLGRQATAAEVNAINEQQARAFYFDRHVTPYQGVDDPLRAFLADWSVTSWHDDPVRALQGELSKRGFYKSKIDGIFGAVTRAALQNFGTNGPADQRSFYLDMVKARMRSLVNLALDGEDVQHFLELNHTTDLDNLRGWVNRVLEFVV